MRIGVNALFLIPGKVGGTEIYLRNTLQALAAVDRVNEYFVLHNRETGADLTPSSPNFHNAPQPVSGESRPSRILFEQLRLPGVCTHLKLDLLFNAGFTAPLLWRGPIVTVFHDFQYIHHPEFFRWWDLPFWRLLLPLSARRSRRVVVLSEAVRDDLAKFYRYPRERIAVIPHGVEPEFQRIANTRDPQPGLLLSVSTLHPHKNLDVLLEAFAAFREHRPGWKLVIAGLKGFEATKIEAVRFELGLENAVTITGWIPRAELYELFRTASAFVYASRFEGFGIPVLEAMASGIPTACSRLPSLVEIAGNAVRYFDPGNIAGMVSALEEITRSDAPNQQGLDRAREFTWNRAAHGLLEIFRQAATRSKNAQD